MTTEQEIANRMAEAINRDKLACRHWLVFFKDPANNEITAYDASAPIKCYASVINSHPNYKFLALRGCESATSAAEFARAIRTASSLISWAEADYKNRQAMAEGKTE